MDPKGNNSNQPNANKGTNGINKQYDQAQGNRGTQMNPNQTGKPAGDVPGGNKQKK